MVTPMAYVKEQLRQLMNWPTESAVHRLARNAWNALEEEPGPVPDATTVDAIAYEVVKEVRRAQKLHNRPFNSAHEGYAVIKEHFDELWIETMKRSSTRDADALRMEAIQLAAMAVRFVHDVIDQAPASSRG